jgi:hypothetical protein
MPGFWQFVANGAPLCVDHKQAGLCAFKGRNPRPQSVKGGLHVASPAKGPGQHGQGSANVASRQGRGRSNGGRSNGAALVEQASGGRRGGNSIHGGGFLVCGGRAPNDCFNVKAKVPRNVNSAGRSKGCSVDAMRPTIGGPVRACGNGAPQRSSLRV